MEAKEYLSKSKDLQRFLIEFIDHGKTIIVIDQLSEILDDPKVKENKYNLEAIFNLTLVIANYHHRYSDFYPKIEQILLRLKESMLKYFSTIEIFNIFKYNKRIVLFLIREKFIIIDQAIANEIQKEEFLTARYHFFLFPEIKTLINARLIDEVQKEVHQISSQNFGLFETKRSIGENDDQICELIRKDSVDEFISYLNKTNTPISSNVKPSIFETNAFLLYNNPTLIEYAAFFGSIQIFKYLHSNGAKLTPSLWIYAIHGNNLEILGLIKENQVKPVDQTYNDCIVESIKCHHNKVTEYIKSNFIQNQNVDDFIRLCAAKYHNYALIPNDVNNIYFFYSLCQNNNVQLVENLLKSAEIKNKINTIIVFNYFIFPTKFKHCFDSYNFNLLIFNSILQSIFINGIQKQKKI